MRLGLVVPRYGQEIIGGTEHWLRLLCEHMVATPGWTVDVYTTCATSAVTWADELPPGDSFLRGVHVHRHPVRSGRSTAYAGLDRIVRAAPSSLPPAVVRRFVEAVGPVCPAMIEEAGASSCDLVAVTPYVFWPAFAAVRRLGRRVLFHPAAHEEAELRFPATQSLFSSVGGFSFNSLAERALVTRTFPVAHLPAAVIGNAVEELPGDEAVARQELGLGPDEPFVICVGRVERTKGVHALAELWRLYRGRRPGAPRLVVIGVLNEPLAGDDHVVVAGPRSDAVKWGALRAAEILVTPSSWESFSLVVVEAWLAGIPVVVNRRCPATVEHCVRGRGGVWFDGYAELEAALDRLLGDADLRQALAGRGQAYARSAFAWPSIVERYGRLADQVLERAA